MKRSKLLLISAIIATLYCIYLVFYFTSGMGSSDGTEALGAGLAAALVVPHFIIVGIGTVFNWVAYGLKLRWAALVAGILFAASILLMPIYFMFVIIEAILCFIAFAKMKKPVPATSD
jgi:hypothetical protein